MWVIKWLFIEFIIFMSCSDDKMVWLWDLLLNNFSYVFIGYLDYVCSGVFIFGGNSNMLVIGFYDEMVWVWDVRILGGLVFIFKYKDLIEEVLFFFGGIIFFVVFGNVILVFDLVVVKLLCFIMNY